MHIEYIKLINEKHECKIYIKVAERAVGEVVITTDPHLRKFIYRLRIFESLRMFTNVKCVFIHVVMGNLYLSIKCQSIPYKVNEEN